MSELFISVIVAEKDSARTIRSCLDSLLAVSYSRFEIIVVDDGSADETPGILSLYAGKIRLIELPKSEGPSSARNIGAAAAAGELVAFTDGDCVVDCGWLSALAAGFSSGDVVSVGGVQAVPDDESSFGRIVARFFARSGFATDYIHSGGGGLRSVEHNASCNSMYRKDPFLREGGFLSGLWPGEDVELDFRLRRKGLRIMFNPAAVVYHYRAPDVKSFCRMMRRYGRAQAALVRRYGITRLIQWVPVVSFLFLISFFVYPVVTILLISLLLLLISRFDLPVTGLMIIAVVYWNAGFSGGIIDSRFRGND
jgi:GT2 family glycosyltransferase